MCLRFVFLLITRGAGWLRLSRREKTWKTAEILILRHQLTVLQRRQPRRPKLNWADRALFAALLSVIPEARRHRLRLLVTPDTIVRWHRDIARRRPTRKDIVVGLSASGRTPYVVAAIAYARARGAKTAAITCNHNTPLAAVSDITVVAEVGPEVVSGSTRMKASTAQKMILNMITTGAMTRLGYVYENLMVNVHMQNSKLVERGIRILMSACKIDRPTAVETIKCAGRSVPVALVMLKAKVDKPEAVRRLAKSDGNVRLAIEDNVLEL